MRAHASLLWLLCTPSHHGRRTPNIIIVITSSSTKIEWIHQLMAVLHLVLRWVTVINEPINHPLSQMRKQRPHICVNWARLYFLWFRFTKIIEQAPTYTFYNHEDTSDTKCEISFDTLVPRRSFGSQSGHFQVGFIAFPAFVFNRVCVCENGCLWMFGWLTNSELTISLFDLLWSSDTCSFACYWVTKKYGKIRIHGTIECWWCYCYRL